MPTPGKDYPRKPRVAKVFKDEDEMDDYIRGIKKEKKSQRLSRPKNFVYNQPSYA